MDLPFTNEDIFSVKEHNFNELTLEIFQFQVAHNEVYCKYVNHLGISPRLIKSIDDIPFIPIELFKSHRVICGSHENAVLKQFTSSSTSKTGHSRHYYADATWYLHSLFKGFERFYGHIHDLKILALLPGYMENPEASLIYMTKALMRDEDNFFLNDFDSLKSILDTRSQASQPTLLIGVSHALLDFVKEHSGRFNQLIVMETGGMKGRKKEMTRWALHDILKSGFGLANIHSEYGMTELFSQAYSTGGGWFSTPPWMKILIREADDPMRYTTTNQSGGINVIDLANVESCSFIATSDIGRIQDDGTFEVLGRFDQSDVRGCNVLVQ